MAASFIKITISKSYKSTHDVTAACKYVWSDLEKASDKLKYSSQMKKTYTKHISEHENMYWKSEKIPNDKIHFGRIKKWRFDRAEVCLVSILFDWFSNEILSKNDKNSLLK